MQCKEYKYPENKYSKLLHNINIKDKVVVIHHTAAMIDKDYIVLTVY